MLEKSYLLVFHTKKLNLINCSIRQFVCQSHNYQVYCCTCIVECTEGSFGANCSSECGHCFGGEPCDKYTGQCIQGCAEGYMGSECLAGKCFSVRLKPLY